MYMTIGEIFSQTVRRKSRCVCGQERSECDRRGLGEILQKQRPPRPLQTAARLLFR